VVRVLFTSTAGRGHLQPLLPLIDAFEAVGHEVLTVAPRSLGPTLVEREVNHRLGLDPPEEESERLWSLFPTLPRSAASALVEREWFAQLCLRALLPAVKSAVSEWGPDLVVRESCEYAGAVVADQLGVAHAQVGISTAAAESSVLHQLVTPDLERSSPGLSARIHEAPYLTTFPASLDPSPYPTTLRYRTLSTKTPKPLPDWWDGAASPLVYCTFGTVATGEERPTELLRSAVSSLRGLDVRILVTTGVKMLPQEFGDTPENVHVESWVDQADVFEHASLVLCHGGSGTTFGALSCGVPLVLLPMFADQSTNANVVRSVGAGLVVAEGNYSADANVDQMKARMTEVRDAVLEILDNASYREAAAAVGEEMKNQCSPTALVERLTQ